MNYERKNVFIIHSWHGNTINSFAPYIENICNNNNISYYYPIFSIGDDASYGSWKKIMDEYLDKGILNEYSMIIGHSIGAHFIPKYLFERKLKINTYVSVAGSIKFIDDKKLNNKVSEFIPSYIELKYLSNNVKNKYSLYSDNDPICLIDGLKEYSNKIKSNEILIKGYGHFGPKSNVSDIKELDDIVIKYIKDNDV